MHFFQSQKIRHSIAFGIGAAIGVIYLMSAIAANADSVGVSIAGNGQTVVKGARVTAVSATELTAVSEWGAAVIQWKVVVTGSTRFDPGRNDEKLTQFVRVGEIVGFSGTMSQKAGRPTIFASVLRNESVLQRATTLDGSVIAVDPTGVLVLTETGTSTIRIGTGTIMTKDGNRARSSDLIEGESIKAFGTYNTRSRVLNAERVLSLSFPAVPNTGADQEKRGFFASLATWLGLGSSALSVR